MLARIGKPAAATDAVDLLLECHERIRSFLALARRVAAADPAEDGVGDAALRVRRYFGEALPLHARDEEESILPRLRGVEPVVDAALETMAREHREHEPLLVQLVGASARVAQAPEALVEVAPLLGEVGRELEALFAEHLRREEEIVFPAMRRLLDRAADAAIVREMRGRRGAR
jgi:iron-sulfur cluster repair protein YtfE (RIC family)